MVLSVGTQYQLTSALEVRLTRLAASRPAKLLANTRQTSIPLSKHRTGNNSDGISRTQSDRPSIITFIASFPNVINSSDSSSHLEYADLLAHQVGKPGKILFGDALHRNRLIGRLSIDSKLNFRIITTE